MHIRFVLFYSFTLSVELPPFDDEKKTTKREKKTIY